MRDDPLVGPGPGGLPEGGREAASVGSLQGIPKGRRVIREPIVRQRRAMGDGDGPGPPKAKTVPLARSCGAGSAVDSARSGTRL